MEQAASQIDAYLAGNTDARIACDSEGEFFRLFHAINSLAALNIYNGLIVVFVMVSVAIAAYVPVKRICSMAITAAINE